MSEEQTKRTKPQDADQAQSAPAPECEADETAKASECVAKTLDDVRKERARADEMTAAAQRLQADFDNYRKRNASAVAKARADGQCEVVAAVLPALDVFDSALALIADESVAKGIKMVQRQLFDVLASFGAEKIPALGCDFDPEFHEAIEQVDSDDPEESGKIVEVLREGYRMGERILRHSVVKVAK